MSAAWWLQENCNLLVSNEYSEKTRRSMAMLSEKEHSFELLEVYQWFVDNMLCDISCLYKSTFLSKSYVVGPRCFVAGWRKVKYMWICIARLRANASNVLRYGSHSVTYKQNHICLYSQSQSITAFWPVLIALIHEGMASGQAELTWVVG